MVALCQAAWRAQSGGVVRVGARVQRGGRVQGKEAASCFGSVQEGEVEEPGAGRAWAERRSGARGREEREEGERRKEEKRKKKRKKEMEKKKKRKREREKERDSRRRPRPDAHARRSGVTRGTRANRETGQRWIRMSGPVFREIGRSGRKMI